MPYPARKPYLELWCMDRPSTRPVAGKLAGLFLWSKPRRYKTTSRGSSKLPAGRAFIRRMIMKYENYPSWARRTCCTLDIVMWTGVGIAVLCGVTRLVLEFWS